MRRLVLIAAVLAVLAGPALAAEPKAPPPDPSVTLAAMALPIVVDGVVINYSFVTVKLMLTPQADSTALRDKEPYFRDALVRAAHRSPFTKTGDNNRLDEGKLKAVMYREAVAIAGPGKIQSVLVLNQTPQHRLATAPTARGASIIP